MTNFNFVVQTCESLALNECRIPFVPPLSENQHSPFDTRDPFGLRKAVFPVFERTPSGELFGRGTAFHCDGWGGCLTAEHVIDFLHEGSPGGGLSPDTIAELDPSTQNHAVVMLGIGLAFGQVGLPPWAIAPVTETCVTLQQRDNPLAALRGEISHEVGFDIAGFQVAIPAAAYAEGRDPPKTLPVHLGGWSPTVGGTVLALGYPGLEPGARTTTGTVQTLIKDGLSASYGTITRLFPEGRDRLSRTPVFEVEADWPAGMSGGPVVNDAGRVVGLVSRSLPPDGELRGFGYAVCLPWIREARRFVPRIDPENPGFRLAYALLSESHGLRGFWAASSSAEQYASKLAGAWRVVRCSQRIGTDEHIML